MKVLRLALFGLFLALAACGYSTDSLMPAGVRSVAVQAFGNETFYRRPEILFTDELRHQLLRRGQVALRDPADADALIRGRIISIPRLTLIEDEDDRILEGGVLVAIEVEMLDAKTGVPLIAPFVVSRRSEYIVPRGESLEFAIDEAIRDAAKDTLDRLQADSFLRSRIPDVPTPVP